jgi:hypothetical protein
MSKFKKDWVELPESFVKGLIVDVEVSVNGKVDTKQLKVCTVKAQSVLFMEVDKVNRMNIFRKVRRRDIMEFRPTAICSIKLRDGVLPTKWESSWDSIGQPSAYAKNFGNARPHFSNHSKGWSSNAPQYRSTTNNPVSGFPMV